MTQQNVFSSILKAIHACPDTGGPAVGHMMGVLFENLPAIKQAESEYGASGTTGRVIGYLEEFTETGFSKAYASMNSISFRCKFAPVEFVKDVEWWEQGKAVGPAPALDVITVTRDEAELLKAVARNDPRSVTQEKLEELLEYVDCRKTVGLRVTALKKRGLLRIPEGKKYGIALTPYGRGYVKQYLS